MLGRVANRLEAKSLAEQAAPQLGVSREVAQDLVGLLAEDRLGSLVLHLEGSVFDLLDLSPAGDLRHVCDGFCFFRVFLLRMYVRSQGS